MNNNYMAEFESEKSIYSKFPMVGLSYSSKVDLKKNKSENFSEYLNKDDINFLKPGPSGAAEIKIFNHRVPDK